MDQQQGSGGAAQRFHRRCAIEIDAISDSGVQEPAFDQRPRKDYRHTVLRQAVARDLAEGRKRALGHDRAEARFAAERFDQGRRAHGQPDAIETIDTGASEYAIGPQPEVVRFKNPVGNDRPAARAVTTCVRCKDGVPRLQEKRDVPKVGLALAEPGRLSGKRAGVRKARRSLSMFGL